MLLILILRQKKLKKGDLLGFMLKGRGPHSCVRVLQLVTIHLPSRSREREDGHCQLPFSLLFGLEPQSMEW